MSLQRAQILSVRYMDEITWNHHLFTRVSEGANGGVFSSTQHTHVIKLIFDQNTTALRREYQILKYLSCIIPEYTPGPVSLIKTDVVRGAVPPLRVDPWHPQFYGILMMHAGNTLFEVLSSECISPKQMGLFLLQLILSVMKIAPKFEIHDMHDDNICVRHVEGGHNITLKFIDVGQWAFNNVIEDPKNIYDNIYDVFRRTKNLLDQEAYLGREFFSAIKIFMNYIVFLDPQKKIKDWKKWYKEYQKKHKKKTIEEVEDVLPYTLEQLSEIISDDDRILDEMLNQLYNLAQNIEEILVQMCNDDKKPVTSTLEDPKIYIKKAKKLTALCREETGVKQIHTTISWMGNTFSRVRQINPNHMNLNFELYQIQHTQYKDYIIMLPLKEDDDYIDQEIAKHRALERLAPSYVSGPCEKIKIDQSLTAMVDKNYEALIIKLSGPWLKSIQAPMRLRLLLALQVLDLLYSVGDKLEMRLSTGEISVRGVRWNTKIGICELQRWNIHDWEEEENDVWPENCCEAVDVIDEIINGNSGDRYRDKDFVKEFLELTEKFRLDYMDYLWYRVGEMDPDKERINKDRAMKDKAFKQLVSHFAEEIYNKLKLYCLYYLTDSSERYIMEGATLLANIKGAEFNVPDEMDTVIDDMRALEQ